MVAVVLSAGVNAEHPAGMQRRKAVKNFLLSAEV